MGGAIRKVEVNYRNITGGLSEQEYVFVPAVAWACYHGSARFGSGVGSVLFLSFLHWMLEYIMGGL